jgi:hypothetical protein
VGFIRADLPDEARDVDIAAFADGHIKGYSVVGEVAANMEQATRLANEAWDRILTFGQSPVEDLRSVCQRIEAAQQTAP